MSTAFNLNAIKRSVVDILKSHLCAEETSTVSTFKINEILDQEIAQSFYPYSTAYRDNRRSFDAQMVIGKVGSPSGSLTLSLMSDYNNSPYRVLASDVVSGTLVPTDGMATVTWDIDLSGMASKRLDSNTRYWLKLNQSSTVDLSNYYTIYQNTVDTGYMMGTGKHRVIGGVSTWDNLNADFNFRASMPNWIYPDYPYDSLSDFSFPRISVDILARNRVQERWICINKAEYFLTLAATIYSKYPEELDDLVSYTDRILWFERLNVSNIVDMHPGVISQITQPRAQLFVKSVTYEARFIMHNEEIS